LSNKEQSNKIL